MENKPRPCGCKGRRTCLICEGEYGLSNKNVMEKGNSYVYCPSCNKAYPGWDMDAYLRHPNHEGDPIDYPGIFIQLDFINNTEEDALMKGIDEMPWDLSQSGRRKQNFGPKCNFKKQKIQSGTFEGFPKFTKFVQDRFEDFPILKNYKTIEQCSLEYDPLRGASIDPHVDDCWVWGERIVTVNLLSDSVLTMTSFFGDQTKYNIPLVSTYPPVLDKNGEVCTNEPVTTENFSYDNEMKDVIVRIPMPRRSLLVIYGPARYQWEHCVLREDIATRRVCIAYREFTPPFLPKGSHFSAGEEILKKASMFWNHLDQQCNA